MKHLLLSMLAVALVVGSALRRDGQGRCPGPRHRPKPVAVVTIASYERIMTDIALIGNLAGNPDLDKNLEGMIQLFTQGQGLNGLDKKRPLGRHADHRWHAISAAADSAGQQSQDNCSRRWPV